MRRKTILGIILFSLCFLSSGLVAKTPPKPQEIRFIPATPEQQKKSPPGMVYVPSGEFIMGSTADQAKDAYNICNDMNNDQCNDCLFVVNQCDEKWFDAEQPQHTVNLDAFLIDKYEATNKQYAACVQAGRCAVAHFDDGTCDIFSGGEWKKGMLPKSFRGGNQPVVCVDWNQSKAYCEWAGKRLPSEAQWEKAARGTDGRMYPWGNKKANCSYAITNDGRKGGCGKNSTWPVGSKPAGASPYGAMDMAGNVNEWVADWYDANYYQRSPNRNPTGPGSGTTRVVRGCGWSSTLNFSRMSYRNDLEPDHRLADYGFRCARTP